jgi:hypothetical protein
MAMYWRCACSHVADDIGYHRRSQTLAQSDFAPRLCPGLISDLVDQAKSVAFSVEVKAKAEALLLAWAHVCGAKHPARSAFDRTRAFHVPYHRHVGPLEGLR